MNCIIATRILTVTTVALLLSSSARSQELFSFTEAASIRPAGSIGIRVDQSMMDETGTSRTNYHLIPAVMVGLSKKVTVAASAFFSNRADVFRKEGGSLYARYRFFSNDKMQEHFRMALYSRVSYNNSDIHQEEIEMNGHNTGAEVGLVATKLVRKVAVSSSVSFVKARDNGDNNKFVYGSDNSRAINYTLSIGTLSLPREYRAYKQTNVNCMLEIINQLNVGSGKYYLDLAPVVQVIVNSQSRIDAGYRKELISSMIRTSPNGFFIRLEHTFFNVF